MALPNKSIFWLSYNYLPQWKNVCGWGGEYITKNRANQLSGVSQGGVNYSYAYDGLGNRLRQTVGSTVTNYLLDTTSGLSQVLADGINTYLYGLGRISQSSASSKEYYLGDALGSVRQMPTPVVGSSLAVIMNPMARSMARWGIAIPPMASPVNGLMGQGW